MTASLAPFTTVSAPPRIETARLLLRPYQTADFEPYAAMWGDPAVVKHISGKPSTRAEAWTKMMRISGLWPLMGFGYWVLEEAESGRFAGEAGFGYFMRGMGETFDTVPEAGWVLAPWAHGRGFASEAVAAITQWADRTIPTSRTVCMIDPDHGASIRVAEKNGYTVYQQTDYHGLPAILLERERVT